MTDHAIEMMWESLNEGGDLKEEYKPEFARDCKEWGLLVAVYNMGFMMGG